MGKKKGRGRGGIQSQTNRTNQEPLACTQGGRGHGRGPEGNHFQNQLPNAQLGLSQNAWQNKGAEGSQHQHHMAEPHSTPNPLQNRGNLPQHQPQNVQQRPLQNAWQNKGAEEGRPHHYTTEPHSAPSALQNKGNRPQHQPQNVHQGPSQNAWQNKGAVGSQPQHHLAEPQSTPNAWQNRGNVHQNVNPLPPSNVWAHKGNYLQCHPQKNQQEHSQSAWQNKGAVGTQQQPHTTAPQSAPNAWQTREPTVVSPPEIIQNAPSINRARGRGRGKGNEQAPPGEVWGKQTLTMKATSPDNSPCERTMPSLISPPPTKSDHLSSSSSCTSSPPSFNGNEQAPPGGVWGKLTQTMNTISLDNSPCDKAPSSLNSSSPTTSGYSSSSLSCTPSPPRSNDFVRARDYDKDLTDLNCGNYQLAKRPGYGKAGKPINLIVNHFKMCIPSGNVYHYDVEITRLEDPAKRKINRNAKKGPEKMRALSMALNRKLFQHMIENAPEFQGFYPAFDGKKSLYTRRKLPFQGYARFQVEFERSQFLITVQPVKSCAINLNAIHDVYNGTSTEVPLEALRALDTIIRHCPSLKLVPIGRSFFKHDPGRYLCDGVEVRLGFHQSIHMGQHGVMLNIDMAATAFYTKMHALDLLAELFFRDARLVTHSSLDYWKIRELEKMLTTVKVFTTHLGYNRSYSVTGLTKKPLRELTLPSDPQYKLVDYFKDKYGIRLEYLNLPCFRCGKDEELPIELCHINGQPFKKKLNPKQTQQMIKAAALPPSKRLNNICHYREEIEKIYDHILKEFELGIDPEPTEVKGRCLEPPALTYKKRKLVPNNGSWDLRNDGFYVGSQIKNWVLVSTSLERKFPKKHLDLFAQNLQSCALKMNLEINKPLDIKICSYDTPFDQILSELLNSFGQLDFVLVILSRKTNYDDIKYAGDNVHGIPTQCIKEENVVKINMSIISGLCNKINAKLGGINLALSSSLPKILQGEDTIIMGADVNHPGPGDTSTPSIAAVVGSLDHFPFRYYPTTDLQTKSTWENRIEVILNIKSMVIKIITAYMNHNKGRKPRKIIFFRDGVSESQFKKILDYEVYNIKEACKELDKNYDPLLTFFIVQKRHHTRFFVKSASEIPNVPSGTTIDQVVTHPIYFDYFQYSHRGLQGTSKPAHYIVLLDENNLQADDIQQLSHFLCFTSARCNKSISMPVPAFYAHLTAFRAKVLLSRIHYNSSAESSSSSHSSCSPSDDMRAYVKINRNHQESMYFV